MTEKATIEQLPAIEVADRAHQLWAMQGGASGRLSVGQILDLLIGAAPGTLDKLDELAAAINNDENFAATMAAELAALDQAIQDINTDGVGNSSNVGGATATDALNALLAMFQELSLGPKVWEALKTDTASTSSSSWAAIPGLSITLTPDSADDEFMVEFICYGAGDTASSGSGVPNFRLVRDSAVLTQADAAGSRVRTHGSASGSTIGVAINAAAGKAIDSPATTSPITYAVQWRRGGDANIALLNRSGSDTDASGFSRTVSSLHVTKVRRQP